MTLNRDGLIMIVLTPFERKVGLMKRGISMSEIGRSLGITGAQVSYVVAGQRRSPRVEIAVAEALGEPIEKVFEPREGSALQKAG